MALTSKTLQPVIDRFTDACRRLLLIAERQKYGFTAIPMKGVDWNQLANFERLEVLAALKSVDIAVEQFEKAIGKMDSSFPQRLKPIVEGIAGIARHACDSARKEGWFEGNFAFIGGWYVTNEFRYASKLSAYVGEMLQLKFMPAASREVLQALLERSPLKTHQLARYAVTAIEADSKFRKMLSQMVKDGLLVSGRGTSSPGYRLTDRGIQLAQMSAQLVDF